MSRNIYLAQCLRLGTQGENPIKSYRPSSGPLDLHIVQNSSNIIYVNINSTRKEFLPEIFELGITLKIYCKS